MAEGSALTHADYYASAVEVVTRRRGSYPSARACFLTVL
jgi:hypothetical protein